MRLPPVRLIRQDDACRLVPSRHTESVLARIAEGDGHLQDLFELDHATNDRLLAENNLAPGIRVHELLFGVPYFRIVNAAFCHPHPLGGRFHGPDRGAWYAAFEVETAQAEVAFHKWVELVEVNWLEESVSYDEFLADFSAELHDLRGEGGYKDCLDPESYVASQSLAANLLQAGSLGVVYPSVRKRGGTCLACFRPVLVMNVRKGATYRFVWSGSPVPAIETIAPAPISSGTSRRSRSRRGSSRRPGRTPPRG
jgi:RES domain